MKKNKSRREKIILISISIIMFISVLTNLIKTSISLVGAKKAFLSLEILTFISIFVGCMYIFKKFEKNFLKSLFINIFLYFLSNLVIFMWLNSINIKIKLSDLFFAHAIDGDMLMGVQNFANNLFNGILLGLIYARGIFLVLIVMLTCLGLYENYKLKNS